jgi:Glycerophosphoryl diester phosphodiesterase family
VVKESGLVCVSYGKENDDKVFVRKQIEAGVDAVIVDSVLAIRNELTSGGLPTRNGTSTTNGTSQVNPTNGTNGTAAEKDVE